MAVTTTCPICQKPARPAADNPAFPFCSKRCQTVDFARWWDGKYQIVETLDPEDLIERVGPDAVPRDYDD